MYKSPNAQPLSDNSIATYLKSVKKMNALQIPLSDNSIATYLKSVKKNECFTDKDLPVKLKDELNKSFTTEKILSCKFYS